MMPPVVVPFHEGVPKDANGPEGVVMVHSVVGLRVGPTCDYMAASWHFGEPFSALCASPARTYYDTAMLRSYSRSLMATVGHAPSPCTTAPTLSSVEG